MFDLTKAAPKIFFVCVCVCVCVCVYVYMYSHLLFSIPRQKKIWLMQQKIKRVAILFVSILGARVYVFLLIPGGVLV